MIFINNKNKTLRQFFSWKTDILKVFHFHLIRLIKHLINFKKMHIRYRTVVISYATLFRKMSIDFRNWHSRSQSVFHVEIVNNLILKRWNAHFFMHRRLIKLSNQNCDKKEIFWIRSWSIDQKIRHLRSITLLNRNVEFFKLIQTIKWYDQRIFD